MTRPSINLSQFWCQICGIAVVRTTRDLWPHMTSASNWSGKEMTTVIYCRTRRQAPNLIQGAVGGFHLFFCFPADGPLRVFRDSEGPKTPQFVDLSMGASKKRAQNTTSRLCTDLGSTRAMQSSCSLVPNYDSLRPWAIRCFSIIRATGDFGHTTSCHLLFKLASGFVRSGPTIEWGWKRNINIVKWS